MLFLEIEARAERVLSHRNHSASLYILCTKYKEIISLRAYEYQ